MVEDIQFMTRQELKNEVTRLRNGIREHRDAHGNARCHINNTKLYAMLPETRPYDPMDVPRTEFLKNCEIFYDEETR